jgi:hypothetical protein
VEKGNVHVRNDEGRMFVITGKQAKNFEVYERLPIGIAPGDKLLLTANRRGNGFNCTNGEIVRVLNIDRQKRIHLDDGRALPKDYRQFSYGYAVTAHRSQGKTVDAVIISGDGMRKELFYVAATRGRKDLAVITSDKERLRESIGCSTARQSASELARKCRPGLHQGLNRGMAAARRLADWASRQLRAVFRQEPTAEPVMKQTAVPAIEKSTAPELKPTITTSAAPTITRSLNL